MTPGAPASDHAVPLRPNEFVDRVRAALDDVHPEHLTATFTGITIDGVHAIVATRPTPSDGFTLELREQHEHAHDDLRNAIELKHSA